MLPLGPGSLWIAGMLFKGHITIHHIPQAIFCDIGPRPQDISKSERLNVSNP